MKHVRDTIISMGTDQEVCARALHEYEQNVDALKVQQQIKRGKEQKAKTLQQQKNQTLLIKLLKRRLGIIVTLLKSNSGYSWEEPLPLSTRGFPIYGIMYHSNPNNYGTPILFTFHDSAPHLFIQPTCRQCRTPSGTLYCSNISVTFRQSIETRSDADGLFGVLTPKDLGHYLKKYSHGVCHTCWKNSQPKPQPWWKFWAK